VTLLSDRLRGMLKSPSPALAPERARPREEHGQPATAADSLERALGGEWREDGGSRCFVVERRVEADGRCGRVRVGDLAAWHERAAAHAPMLTAGAPARPPFVFFDLETTGLSGGAGTYAFLVGCGRFADGGAFLTRQYVLAAFGDERSMLETVARELARAEALVSFNGKSFDAPLLETRYLFHRLDWTAARLPHIDVLHPARRFWGATPRERGDDDNASCSLAALEHQVLGMRRVDDVRGFEIPGRYFQFVRSGDARPLAPVLEHNRLDLLSLAGLTARLMHLIAEGPDEAADAREALALARVYGRSGLEARAREAFERVVSMCASVADGRVPAHASARLEPSSAPSPDTGDSIAHASARPERNSVPMTHAGGPMTYASASMAHASGPMADTSASVAYASPPIARATAPLAHASPSIVHASPSMALIETDALRALACAARRARRFEDAAALWRLVLDVAGCPERASREATRALAVHHEHRSRNLAAAKAFAQRSLDSRMRTVWNDAVKHRLARIERKMTAEGKTDSLLKQRSLFRPAPGQTCPPRGPARPRCE
jgi:uncharacterized protein YprB with RNaseH-like and TPR domain